jgi:hypothetical protein
VHYRRNSQRTSEDVRNRDQLKSLANLRISTRLREQRSGIASNVEEIDLALKELLCSEIALLLTLSLMLNDMIAMRALDLSVSLGIAATAGVAARVSMRTILSFAATAASLGGAVLLLLLSTAASAIIASLIGVFAVLLVLFIRFILTVSTLGPFFTERILVALRFFIVFPMNIRGLLLGNPFVALPLLHTPLAFLIVDTESVSL